MENREWSKAELQSKAERYCANTERCLYDVRQKLLQWSATPDQIADIMAHLVVTRFVDEQRYCCAFVHDKVVYDGWGRMKIRAYLQAKQLPSAAISTALDDMDEAEYACVLKRVIASKRKHIPTDDSQAREKLIRFCMQRGFTYDEISQYL